MSRWIELEPLIADLDKGLWGKDYDKALAEAIIQDAPSIEIIRCRECKYVDTKKCPMYFRGLGYTDDDFCSYGSRSEKPNNLERSSE